MASSKQGGSKATGGKSQSAKGTTGKAMAAGAAAPAGSEAQPTKKKTSVPEFVRQVRQETAKVTWPTRKETTVTTIMVFIMVFLAAIFFFVVDQLLGLGVGFLLGIAG